MSMTSGPAGGPGGGVDGNGSRAGRSHLVAGTRIVGDITAPGTLEIQGRVEGRVVADAVVVEEKGVVEGEVKAEAIGVKGTVSGHLAGAQVRVHATAKLSGTVRYGTLMIESGAEITATCERAPAAAARAGAESPVTKP